MGLRFRVRYINMILILLLSLSSSANDSSHKLSEILVKIKNIKQLLVKHQSLQVSVENNLQQTETKINQLAKQLQSTSSELTQIKANVAELNSQARDIEKKISCQKTMLLKQIRSTYLLGLNKNKLRFLLEADELNQINRLLTYNRYFTQRNHNLIQCLQHDLASLSKNRKETLAHATHLEELKRRQDQQQKLLDSNKRQQQLLLHQVSLKVKSHTDELNELLKNKKNLEDVIHRLQKKETYSSEFLTHHSGRFPWPTQGKIIERFGSAIHHSELKQNGVLIQAPEGEKVYSVAPGKVIFSSWMPGYGLLLIIDHGKGYMTLYGNNGVLYKKTHDLIANHELIALVGHTGGNQKSALYFGLRYKGKAIDPAIWCH